MFKVGDKLKTKSRTDILEAMRVRYNTSLDFTIDNHDWWITRLKQADNIVLETIEKQRDGTVDFQINYDGANFYFSEATMLEVFLPHKNIKVNTRKLY